MLLARSIPVFADCRRACDTISAPPWCPQILLITLVGIILFDEEISLPDMTGTALIIGTGV